MHQQHSLLLWLLGYHGDHSDTSIIHLSQVVLISSLVWSFLGTIGIIAMVTKLPWQLQWYINQLIFLCHSYLVSTFFGMVGIRNIHQCYGNKLAMATTAIHQLNCLKSCWVHIWYQLFLGQQTSATHWIAMVTWQPQWYVNNSFVSSCIDFIFGLILHWDNGIIAMVTRLATWEPQWYVNNSFVLSDTEFIFSMKLP